MAQPQLTSLISSASLFPFRVTCQVVFKGKHGICYTLYVLHRLNIALLQLHDYYRDRFGIETSYRLKNQGRIRTTTKIRSSDFYLWR